MEDLCRYLTENFIEYQKIEKDIVQINGLTYEFFSPNENNRLFDEDFCWECEKTECDRYVFKFGGCWYWFNRGEESKPKLNRLKYIGKARLNLPETETVFFLGVHGPFELLNGCNSYKDWARKAKFLGIQRLGICEKKTAAGLFKFQTACLSEGITPVLGMEIPIKNKTKDVFFTVKAFIKDSIGWRSLMLLNKQLNVDNNGFIDPDDLIKNKEGLFIILDPKSTNYEDIPNDWLILFSNEFYYQLDTVIYNKEDRDEWYLKNLKRFFNSRFSPIAMSDAYYLDKEYSIVRESLNRIAGVINYESDNQYFKNSEEYFLELQSLFKNDDDRFFDTYEKAIENLYFVSKNCNYLIETGKRHLPKYSMTDDEKKEFSSNREMFEELIYKGLEEKITLLDQYGDKEIAERINKEISTIEYGELEDYFLILRDIINWAHSQGIITGRGRGSGAGSLVNYLLKLTDVDPLRYNLLFSRFLNEGRLWKEKEIEQNGEKIKIRVPGSLPDIDTDTPGEQRPRIKEYMEQRFGKSQVCSVGTYTTLQLKAALTDLSKLYGISIPTIRSISKKINGLDDKTIEDFFKVVCRDGEMKAFVEKYPELINIMNIVLGQPKAASIHACAMMIFPDDKTMYEWVPIHKQKARTTDTDMIVTDWEGSELDEAGFLKEDILGIEQLDKFADILALIKQHTGKEIDLSKISLSDRKVFEYFKKGWLNDVFHFGAKGLSGYVVKVQPDSIDDLGICAALYRPGPMENNFHNEFLLRRSGEKEINYPIGAEHILEKSYGLMCFQEDLIRMVQDLAGFTEAQGDEVRKCIGKKLVDKIKTIEPRFVDGYVKNYSSKGVTKQYAKDLWKQMEEFGKYSFNACLSGRETIYRHSVGKRFNPTIEEMFKIKNDCTYAKITGHKELHSKYKNKGYGCSWTLYEDGKIRKTQIKDIRYAGYRQTFKIVLETGQSIIVTDNHKFPTQRGKVETKDLIVGEDYLFVNKGYIQENNFFAFTSNLGKEENKKIKGTHFEYQGINSEKGKEGFQKRNTSYTQLKQNESILRSKYDKCQLCGKECNRLEIHHKDSDHGNNDMSNLILICSSCHKKIHYKQFSRNKIGEKGLSSGLVRIISIEPDRMEDVYDVEIDNPNHNFVTKEGIVTCNSHAISYSINGYTSMWLKVHYPIEFWAITFSRASADDYPYYINEINQSGEIEIKPVDINESGAYIVSDPKDNSMYWALNSVVQLGEKAQIQLMEDRQKNGPYFSFEEFVDRVTVKGSSINKSVVENLIYSGAFDSLEKLNSILDREQLLIYYRQLKCIKIDESKDEYSLAKKNGNKIKEEWWWQLQQKRISGYGFFDYTKLIKKYLLPVVNDDDSYIILDNKQFKTDNPISSQRVVVGGYCIDVDVRKCRQGLFATLFLENNYEFIEVTVFSDVYEEYKDFIDSFKKNVVLLNGIALWNNYREKNLVQTTTDTYFIKLSVV